VVNKCYQKGEECHLIVESVEPDQFFIIRIDDEGGLAENTCEFKGRKRCDFAIISPNLVILVELKCGKIAPDEKVIEELQDKFNSVENFLKEKNMTNRVFHRLVFVHRLGRTTRYYRPARLEERLNAKILLPRMVNGIVFRGKKETIVLKPPPS